MKSAISYILPIALAIILPGLNFFSNSIGMERADFFKKWFLGSAILYSLWYVLFWATKIFRKHTGIYLFFTIIITTMIIYFGSSFIFFRDFHTIKYVFLIKFFSASLLFLMIQYSIRMRDNYLNAQLENEQIRSENYKVQLQDLRAKVEPHFLFNSLNTLRTMIRKKNANSENFVMNLSNFYRKTLQLHNSPTSKLSDELDLLKSYLFLMENRNECGIEVEMQIDEVFLTKEVPTLSLQMLLENCFKHNRISSMEPLKIDIYTDENGFVGVKNSILPKFTLSESSGFGLENIEKRYELLGHNEAVFIIEIDDFFEVKLKLI